MSDNKKPEDGPNLEGQHPEVVSRVQEALRAAAAARDIEQLKKGRIPSDDTGENKSPRR